ncbi:MAG: twin-arginine translocation signal domain-containing protein, partial [Rhodobacteraceae bacterium]
MDMLQGDEAMIINRRNFMIGTAASCATLAGVSKAQSATRPLPILPMTDLTNG